MRFLFLAPQVSLPPMDGAERRAWHLYRSMVAGGTCGCFVGRTLFVRGLELPQRHSPARSWRNRKFAAAVAALATGQDYWQTKHLLPGARRLILQLTGEPYDIVLTSMLYSLPLAAPFFHGNTPVVVDTHNYDAAWFHSLGAGSRNVLLRFLCNRAVRNSKRALASLSAGTVLVHVSEADASRYRRDRPDLSHVVVENGTTVRPRSNQPDYATTDKRVLMFVGSLSARMNQDALRLFAARFWPVLRDISVFRVAGSNPSNGVRHLCRCNGWDLHPDIADDQLAHLYDEAHFAVLPFAYGEGSKLKLFEACGRGVPVLTTNAGLCGMTAVPDLVMAAESPNVWAERVARRTVPAPALIRQMIDFAAQFSWDKLSGKLLTALENALAKHSKHLQTLEFNRAEPVSLGLH